MALEKTQRRSDKIRRGNMLSVEIHQDASLGVCRGTLTKSIAPQALLLSRLYGRFQPLECYLGQNSGSCTWIPKIKYPRVLLFPLDRGEQ